MPGTLDDLDVKEKDSVKYDKIEMRQKDVPELADTDMMKDSGASRVEEPRRYLYCYAFKWGDESCMAGCYKINL